MPNHINQCLVENRSGLWAGYWLKTCDMALRKMFCFPSWRSAYPLSCWLSAIPSYRKDLRWLNVIVVGLDSGQGLG